MLSTAPAPPTLIQFIAVFVAQAPAPAPPSYTWNAASNAPIPLACTCVFVSTAVNLYHKSSSGVPQTVASADAVAP